MFTVPRIDTTLTAADIPPPPSFEPAEPEDFDDEDPEVGYDDEDDWGYGDEPEDDDDADA